MRRRRRIRRALGTGLGVFRSGMGHALGGLGRRFESAASAVIARLGTTRQAAEPRPSSAEPRPSPVEPRPSSAEPSSAEPSPAEPRPSPAEPRPSSAEPSPAEPAALRPFAQTATAQDLASAAPAPSGAPGAFSVETAAERSTSELRPTEVGVSQSPKHSVVRVRFDVQAATRWGEVVGVVGNEPALGSWLPERAIILAPNAYPTWSGVAEIAVEGAPTDIEYKYIVRGANNEYRWEARIDNRRATVSASDEDQQVRDEADWPGVT